jgi:DNA polymerase III subunit epsilon
MVPLSAAMSSNPLTPDAARSLRRAVARALSLGTGVAAAIAAPLLWLAQAQGWPPVAVASAGAIAAVFAVGIAFLSAERALAGPFVRLLAELRLGRESRTVVTLKDQHFGSLAPLADEVASIAAALAQERAEADARIAQATAALQTEKRRLEAILRDMGEALLVCDLDHRIVLYNRQVVRLLGVGAEFGLLRSLLDFLDEEPIRSALAYLQTSERDDASVPLATASRDARSFFTGRMTLVREPGEAPSGYVLTLASAIPAGTDAQTSGLADIYSPELFRFIADRMRRHSVAVTLIGAPSWIKAESAAIVAILEAALAAVGTGGRAELGAVQDRDSLRIEATGEGATLSDAELQQLLVTPLGPGGTLGASLARQGGRIENLAAAGRRGVAILLAAAQFRPADATLEARPEFHDLSLLGAPPAAGERSLGRLDYVVFDTETTGLQPRSGDEIVSIGAVRILNGRILTGETFSRLVNPGRPIPASSTRFHGLTDAMVEDAPPITVVLPQFKVFAANSVLVAHNAAFDLAFLNLRAEATGLRFANPVLDTLLISRFLEPDLENHSLDAIARRYGIVIANRHSALADAQATAAIFLRLLEALAARGVTTIDELMRQSKIASELRARARTI